MKKLFLVLSSVVMSACAVISVNAQSGVQNVNVDYDRDNRIVKISGNSDYLDDNEMVHLMLMKPEADLKKAESGEAELKDLTVHIDDIKANGTEFEFNSFKLPSTCTMNDYEIRVTAKNKIFQSVLYVADKNEILALLQNVSAENVPVYICKYNDVLMLDVDEGSTFYTMNTANKNRVYSDLSGKSYSSFSDFKSKFNASTVLAKLSECSWGETEKLISDNNADLNLDLTNFLSMSQTNRDNVSMKVCGKGYKNTQELQEAINVAVTEQQRKSNNGNTSSGDGGGSSSGKPFIKPSPDLINEDKSGNIGFSDMKGYEWQKKALRSCHPMAL